MRFSDLIQGDEKNPLGILREVHRDPASESSLRIAASWLANCFNNHAQCSPTVPGCQILPRRLLNVGDENKDPFLVEPAANSHPGRWVALSYCWGGEPSMRLTKENIGRLKQGIALNRFDATIRDAILVTRALGITYLWVDALCILQDHDSRDWNEQSSKMTAIYGGSTLTIVAANSNSVMQGFLKERKLQYIPLSWVHQTARDGQPLRSRAPQRLHISPSWNPEDDKITGPWTTRGWTMQEGLLPNRLLFYTSSQMIWKCCTILEYERGCKQDPLAEISDGFIDTGGQDIWNFDNFSKLKALSWYLQLIPETLLSEKYRLWYALVEDYTPRRFKHIQDRLVAISGLAKLFGDLIQDDEYVAGLWRRDMTRGLSWHVSGAKLIPSKTTQSFSVPTDKFPSWTWASVGYDVVVNDHAKQDALRSFSVIEDVQLDLVDPANPFGAVRSGSITITGPLFELSRLYNEQWRCNETPMSALERYVSNVVEKESVGGVEERFSSPNGRFAVLQMLQHFPSMDKRLDLLVLEVTGDTSDGMILYHRLGLLTLRYINRRITASPALVKALEKSKGSLRSQLGSGSHRRSETLQESKEVFKEMVAEPWPRRTIIII
jgi:hypothetical protein